MTRPMQPTPLVLASTSPRRAQLMREAGYAFEIVTPPFVEPEEQPGHLDSGAFAESLAFFKASSVARACMGKTILAADTIAFVDGQIIGKPHDRNDARRILDMLSGTTHQVVTGLAILDPSNGRRLMSHDTTRVCVRRLTASAIESYLDTGAWEGKAGAYGVQDKNDPFVERLDGSFSNVVGLPLELLERMMTRWVSTTEGMPECG